MSLHTFMFGSKIDKYLVHNLFKHDTPDLDGDSESPLVAPQQKKMRDLAKRTPVQVNYGWTWRCRKKTTDQRLLEKAGDRTSRELDVVTFVKKQIREGWGNYK